MLIAARTARDFSKGMDWDGFQQSLLHQHAIMRTVEIIGEAARRVSQETRDAHPEVPWNDIIGMRHRLVHEYFRIHLRRVWDTVQDEIPRLIEILEGFVPPDRA